MSFCWQNLRRSRQTQSTNYKSSHYAEHSNLIHLYKKKKWKDHIIILYKVESKQILLTKRVALCLSWSARGLCYCLWSVETQFKLIRTGTPECWKPSTWHITREGSLFVSGQVRQPKGSNDYFEADTFQNIPFFIEDGVNNLIPNQLNCIKKRWFK